jgi:hypothetical protein
MSDEELRDQLMTLLLLGHETTASALSWAFYWVHKEPAVLAQLQQELESLDNAPDPDRLAQLPYLTAVCKSRCGSTRSRSSPNRARSKNLCRLETIRLTQEPF